MKKIRDCVSWLVVLVTTLFSLGISHATVWDIGNVDGLQVDDSTISATTTYPLGVTSWSIKYGSRTTNIYDPMWREWFWYRIGATDKEASFSTLTAAGVYSTDYTSATITFTDKQTPARFKAIVKFEVPDKAAFSYTSTVKKTVTIQNLTLAELDYHLFSYSDLDISTGGTSDNVAIVKGERALQTGFDPVSGAAVGHTLVQTSTLKPSAYGLDTLSSNPGSIMESLDKSGPTQLPNDGGPNFETTDMQFAFQYDLKIPANGSVTFDITSTMVDTKPMNLTYTAPACASYGGDATYQICVDNSTNAVAANNVVISQNLVDPDTFASNLEFVGATDGGVSDPATGAVTWTLPALDAGATKCVQATVRVDSTTAFKTGAMAYSDETFPVQASASTPLCNYPPQVTSTAPATALTGVLYSYQITATDTENNALTFTLVQAPAGMTMNAAGLIKWAPVYDQKNTSFPVTVDVSDGTSVIHYNFSIYVNWQNMVPTAPAMQTTNAVVNQPVSYQVLASDPDNQPLTYTTTDPFPAGLTLSSTGLLSGTPTATGMYVFNVKVTDTWNASVMAPVIVDIKSAVIQPPTITAIPNATTTAPASFSYQVAASDPQGQTLAYTLSGNPTGMTIGATGLISWTTSMAGTYSITVTATNSSGLSANRTFSLTVNPEIKPPTVTPIPLQIITAPAAFSYQVVATDPQGQALTYTLIAPAGMTISTTGLINWSSSVTGNYNITVRVTNTSGRYTEQTFTLTVNVAPQAPTMNVIPNAAITAPAPFTYQVVASDPQNQSLTYTLSGNPAGMTINGSGLISWTASVGGSYTVRATATNTSDLSVSRTFILTVNKTTPTITWAAPAAISYGTPLSATQLKATASVPGTFTYTPAAGTVLNAGSQTLSVLFTPTDSAAYSTATASVSLTVNKAAATVSLSGLTATYDGSAKSVTATTNPVGKTVTITYAGNATAPTAAGSYAVVATINDVNYTGSATGTLVIAKATPTVTWATPTAVYVGSTLGSSQLNATTNVPGSFTYTPAAGTTMSTAGNQTLSAAFTPTDTTNYNTASATVILAVTAKQAPTITWATPAAITYGIALSGTQLNATASVAGTFTYTPSAGTVLNAGTQTLNVTFTPTDTTTYSTASKSVTLTVNKAAATVSLSGLTATYDGSAKSVTATTTPAGKSVTVTYVGSATAPTAAGSYAVVATINDVNYTGSATGTLTIAKATPTITWTTPTAVYVGSTLGSTQLNATASTAGSFAYTPAAGTTMSTAGNQTLSAAFTPTDTTNYNTASATVILAVTAKQVPTITWAAPAAISYGTPLSATQLNATASVPGTFTYTPAAGTVLNAGTQTLSVLFTPTDSATYSTATASVTLTVNKAAATVSLSGLTATYDGSAKSVTAITNPVGKTVTITYAGNATAPTAAGSYAVVATINDVNYTGSATGTMVIAKATPTINWATPTAVYVGTILSATQLNATASTAGSFVYTPAAGTVLNTVGIQTLSTTFTPTDTANYTSATASVSLTVTAKQVPTITWATPAAISYGTALSATQLNASAGTVAGTFTYTPAAGTVLNAGTQTLSVLFTPTDSATYSTATASVTLTVNKAAATVTLAGLTATYDGSAKSVTATTTPAGKSVTVTYAGNATAPTAAGSYAVVATITDANYTGSATGTLVIAKATPTVTWSTPTAVYVGTVLSATQLNATASTAGSFTYTPAAGTTMSTAGNQTLSAAFTPTDTTNYNTASATVILAVTAKQVPTITWATPAAITYGTALSGTQLNASAGTVAGTFTYTPAAGTVLNAGTQTLSVLFTPTDSATHSTATASVSLTVNKAAATVSLSGLTATYDGSAKSVTATTNPVGKTVTITYAGNATAPTAAGSYAVVATINDVNYTGSATGTMVIAKATPTINWTTPTAVYVGTVLSATQLNATTNVPGSFTYTPAAGTTMSTAGNQTLSAAFTPTDTANYSNATATVSLTVTAKQVPTITWAAPAAISYGTALSATQLKATANVAGTFTYTPAAGTVLNAGTQTLSVLFTPTDGAAYSTATASVSLTVNKAAATVTLAGLTATYDGSAKSVTAATNPVGKTVTVTYAGNATAPTAAGNYAVVATINDVNYSGSATGTLTIAKATPTVTWATPTAVYVGSTLGSSQLNATTNVAGTFVYTPAAGTVLNTVGTQTLSTTFTPTDTANYTSATASVSLTVTAKQVPTITWAAPAAISYGTPLSAAQLNATASVPGTFTYTPATGTVLNAGTQTLSVLFTPTDTTLYSTATASVALTVNKATPTVTWATPTPVYVGTTLGSSQLNATASAAGSFTYTPAAGTTMSTAGNQTLTASFTPTDTANYTSATASVSLTVTAADKTTPTITWAAPAAISYGTALSATQLNATSSVPGTFVYTPAAGTVLNVGTQTLSVTFTPTDTTLYNTATASVSLTVNKATAAVTLGGLSQTYSGTAKNATATTTPTGLTVNFTYNGSAASPTAAGSYTVVGTITDPNYTGSATGTMAIAKATPTITWATPNPATVGTTLSSTQLNAAANVAGTFVYTPAAGTILDTAGSQTLSAAFTPSDTANYNNATASVTLTVASTTTQAPVITSQAVTTAYRDGYYYYQVMASDPDGGAVSFSLPTRPSGMTINSATGLIYWHPEDTGSYSVTVKATDPSGLSASQSFRISVVYSSSNSSPQITSVPVKSAVVDTLYRYDVNATDSNGDTVYYRLTSAPSGMAIDLTSGLITWTPTSSQTGSKYVSVEARDSKGGKSSQSFYVSVSASSSNNPPVLTTPSSQTSAEGAAVSLQVVASDPDGDALIYGATGLPSGLAINSSTGVISGTLGYSAAGSYTVTVTAKDAAFTATATFTWTVNNQTVNQAPVITSQAVTTAYRNGYYYYQVTASDPDGGAVSFSLPTRPSGMTINSATGLIYWHPEDTGSYSVTVKATDSAGLSASQSFRISVIYGSSNSSPQITSTPVKTASVGTLYSYDVNSTDSNGDTVYYRLTSAPSGMAIDLTSGLITWTPTSSQTGLKYVKIEAFDSKGGKSSQSFYVSVTSVTGSVSASSVNPCDVSGDGLITGDDMKMIIAGWGTDNLKLDVDGDGAVTKQDLLVCAMQTES